MKIAFDSNVFKALDTVEMVHLIADWGYKYIKQSAHPKINPCYRYPKASRETIAQYKKALNSTKTAISSFSAHYRWSGPTEDERQIAVYNWKRLIEIANEMEVNVITSELLGLTIHSEQCEAMWYRSMNELLPILKKNDIRIDIVTSSSAFCETDEGTLDLVKSLHSDNVGYLFHPVQHGDSTNYHHLLRYADEDLSHVELSYSNHSYYTSYQYIQPEKLNFNNILQLLNKMNFANKNKKMGGDPIITVSILDHQSSLKHQAINIREYIEQHLVNQKSFLLEKIAKNYHKNFS